MTLDLTFFTRQKSVDPPTEVIDQKTVAALQVVAELDRKLKEAAEAAKEAKKTEFLSYVDKAKAILAKTETNFYSPRYVKDLVSRKKIVLLSNHA